MADIVEFPGQEEESGVWACNCGCVTHFVYDDGTVECANCFDTGPERARVKFTEIPFKRPDSEALVTRRMVDVDDKFLYRRIQQEVMDDGVVGVAVFYESGRVRSVTEQSETDEQKTWWKRRVKDFMEQIGIFDD